MRVKGRWWISALFLVFGIWRCFLWVLDWYGRIETITDLYDIMPTFIDFLLHPYVALISIGFGFIYLIYLATEPIQTTVILNHEGKPYATSARSPVIKIAGVSIVSAFLLALLTVGYFDFLRPRLKINEAVQEKLQETPATTPRWLTTHSIKANSVTLIIFFSATSPENFPEAAITCRVITPNNSSYDSTQVMKGEGVTSITPGHWGISRLDVSRCATVGTGPLQCGMVS